MLGITLAAAFVVTVLRVMPLRRMLGWATPIDIGFSALLVWSFHGTLAGMTGAAVGGLVLALALTLGRWLCGYRKPALVRSGRFSWRYVEIPVRSPVFGWIGRIADKIAAVHSAAIERTKS